jgi:RNA polymerase sigma-70 factor (ECF subfamily)
MASDDFDAFSEQVVQNQHRVFAYIVTLVPNRTDAEDIYQDTCLTLWKKWEEYRRPDNFFAWACGIAHNHVRNARRTSQPASVQLSDDALMQVAETRAKADDLMEIRSHFLALCMAKLTESQRQLMERCYLGDESIKEIAESMHISPAALTMRLQRIRRILFECIELASQGQGGGVT